MDLLIVTRQINLHTLLLSNGKLAREHNKLSSQMM